MAQHWFLHQRRIAVDVTAILSALVSLLDKVYEKGVKLSKSGLAKILPYIVRNPELKKWDVAVVPGMESS